MAAIRNWPLLLIVSSIVIRSPSVGKPSALQLPPARVTVWPVNVSSGWISESTATSSTSVGPPVVSSAVNATGPCSTSTEPTPKALSPIEAIR